MRKDEIWKRFKRVPCCGKSSASTDLFDERLILEVRSTDAEVDDIHAEEERVVEGIEEPGRVGNLSAEELHDGDLIP